MQNKNKNKNKTDNIKSISGNSLTFYILLSILGVTIIIITFYILFTYKNVSTKIEPNNIIKNNIIKNQNENIFLDYLNNNDYIYININVDSNDTDNSEFFTIFNDLNSRKKYKKAHITILTISFKKGSSVLIKNILHKNLNTASKFNIDITKKNEYLIEDFGFNEKFKVLNNIHLTHNIAEVRNELITNIIEILENYEYLNLNNSDIDNGIYKFTYQNILNKNIIENIDFCFLEKKAYGDQSINNSHITFDKINEIKKENLTSLKNKSIKVDDLKLSDTYNIL